MRSVFKQALFLSAVLTAQPLTLVAQSPRADLPDRIRGAERVVAGRVVSIDPVMQQNEFGDILIVSRTTVEIEETFKGPAAATLVLEIEGGTIGDQTLMVSDIEPLGVGDRGVFIVGRTSTGAFVPYLRGQGLLKLDSENQVSGEPWSLGDIRSAARAQAAR